eukprot:jgi/Chlat1/3337/Chrsp23S03652
MATAAAATAAAVAAAKATWRSAALSAGLRRAPLPAKGQGSRRLASGLGQAVKQGSKHNNRHNKHTASVTTAQAVASPPSKEQAPSTSTVNGAQVSVENVVIVGSGPAGYTAAIYAARANLRPVVLEGYQAGGVRGGQLMTTTEVENFPGFPEGITGPDLMDRMRSQAERWGAILYTEDVESVDLSKRPFTVKTSERTFQTHSLIVATGATALRLQIPSEEKFWSNGISACAICDGSSFIFRDKELAVVGGGDTACEEAVYLTKYGSQVHLLVRKDKLRASAAMQDRVLNHPKVQVHFNCSVVDALPDKKDQMGGLRVKNNATNEEFDLPARGLFYGIGHRPNSDIIKGQVELDEAGYVKVRNGVETNVRGVYAAGDLHDHEFRQAVTAAGSGCMAAISAERYLTQTGLIQEFHQSPREEHKQQEDAKEAAVTPEVEFDPEQTRHAGQYALRKLYHESTRPIAVLYTQPSCGPCRTLKPIFGRVVDEFDGRMHYVEIDIDADPEISEAAGVTGTPTLHIFKDKKRISVLNGVKSKKEYREAIEANL